MNHNEQRVLTQEQIDAAKEADAKWDKKRAIAGFLEIAESALSGVFAICNELDDDLEKVYPDYVDKIHEARKLIYETQKSIREENE